MKTKRWMFLAAVLLTGVALQGRITPLPPALPVPPADVKVVRVFEVRPGEVAPGEFATAYGTNLDVTQVRELWLVDGTFTVRLEILERTAHSILFRVPAWTATGRWQIAVGGDNEMLIEQGVYLNVRPIRGLPRE